MADTPQYLTLRRNRDAPQAAYVVAARRVLFALLAALALLALANVVGQNPRALRPVLEAEPLILIENGRVVERNLRRERMAPEEVAAEARLQQITSLDDVRWAVLESNGKISFVPK